MAPSKGVISRSINAPVPIVVRDITVATLWCYLDRQLCSFLAGELLTKRFELL